MIALSVNGDALLAAAQRFDTARRTNASLALAFTAQSIVREIASGQYFQNHTSDTKDSFQGVSAGDLAYAVTSRSKVAGWLNAGTRPHVIRPKLAKGFMGPARPSQGRHTRKGERQRHFLKFTVNGATMFRRTVNHPGTKALNFEFIEALRARVYTLPELLNSAVDRATHSSGLA